MLTTPFATRINQAAEDVVIASIRLNAICDASIVTVDPKAFNQAEGEYLASKKKLDAIIASEGIDPDTLRRAVEA